MSTNSGLDGSFEKGFRVSGLGREPQHGPRNTFTTNLVVGALQIEGTPNFGKSPCNYTSWPVKSGFLEMHLNEATIVGKPSCLLLAYCISCSAHIGAEFPSYGPCEPCFVLYISLLTPT